MKLKKHILWVISGVCLLAVAIIILAPRFTKTKEVLLAEQNIASNEEISDEELTAATLLNEYSAKYGHKFKPATEEIKQKLYGTWEVGDGLGYSLKYDITGGALDEGKLQVSKDRFDITTIGPILKSENEKTFVLGHRYSTKSYQEPIFAYYEETLATMKRDVFLDCYSGIEGLDPQTLGQVVIAIAKDSSFADEYMHIEPSFLIIDDYVIAVNQSSFYELERMKLDKVLSYQIDYHGNYAGEADTKKMWIMDDDYEGSSPFSFMITKIENGAIEGKIRIGEFTELNDTGNEMRKFSGVIEGNIAKCRFEDEEGIGRTLELTFFKDDTIKGTLKYFYQNLKNDDKDGTYFFRPYNLKDVHGLEYEAFEENSGIYNGENLDSWGKANIITGIINASQPYPVVYLTDEEGDILYDFSVSDISGTEVKDILIEDFNGDGLKDVKIITWFSDASNGNEFTWLYCQNEDGLFYKDEQETEETSVQSDSEKEYPHLTPEEVSVIMHKIKEGDLSYIRGITTEDIQNFEGWHCELIIVDVNRDGYEDIVFREKDERPDWRVIFSILSYENNMFQYVFEDLIEAPYFSLLSADNRRISAHEGSNVAIYDHSYFWENDDENWSSTLVYGIQELLFDGIADLPEGWLEENFPEIPDIKDGDSFFWKYTDIVDSNTGKTITKRELISKDEFLQLFKEMTGFDYMPSY